MFSQHYRRFWSSNVGNVGLKYMYDRVLKAVVTCILLENLSSKK